MVTVSHMHHNIVEINNFDPQMLPGYFLYEKEDRYEAKWYTTSSVIMRYLLQRGGCAIKCNKMVNWHAIYPVIQLH